MTPVELGAALKTAREREGLLESEIATRLRVPVLFVSAIEQGDLDAFPHRVYARGFVKNYVSLLHLPMDGVLEALEVVQEEVYCPDTTVRPSLLERINERLKESRLAVYIGIIVLAIALVIGVFCLSDNLPWKNIFWGVQEIITPESKNDLPHNVQPQADTSATDEHIVRIKPSISVESEVNKKEK